MKNQQPMMKGNLTLNLGSFQLETGDFAFSTQGITAISGSSGCGKSTFLRALCGLENKLQGELYFGEEPWLNSKVIKPVQHRNVGFVFQDAALFPHQTVLGNLNYAVKRSPKFLDEKQFEETVSRMGIKDLFPRTIDTLSGGEKQRVAITRALLAQPDILFMDEPLSALDWQAKEEILNLIEEVVEHFKVPLIFISHSPAEVERLADRVVFMAQGRIEQIASLHDALDNPKSPLFRDVGVVSVLEGEIQDEPENKVDDLISVKVGEETLWLSDVDDVNRTSVRIRVLAKDVSLALADPEQLSILNHLPAEVLEMIPSGKAKVLVRLGLRGQQKLFAEITLHSADRLGIKAGVKLFALIKSVSLSK